MRTVEKGSVIDQMVADLAESCQSNSESSVWPDTCVWQDIGISQQVTGSRTQDRRIFAAFRV